MSDGAAVIETSEATAGRAPFDIHNINTVRAWIGLWSRWGYAPASFARAMARFEAPGEVLRADEATLEAELRLSAEALGRLREARAEAGGAWEGWLIGEGARELEGSERGVVAVGSALHEALVGAMRSPPPFLFVRGAMEVLERAPGSRVAVVGSRRVSEGALRQTRALASAVVEQGGVVVSGGALGVDGAAHRGALDAGGATVVVLAVGLDRLYPRSHRRLFERVVAEGGALVTPFPLGVGARRHHFPRRNEVMASMSVATMVTRARVRSGSLMTAEAAAKMGRLVGAVPGDVGLDETAGSNQLLELGATPLVSAASVRPFMERARAAAKVGRGVRPGASGRVPWRRVREATEEEVRAQGELPLGGGELEVGDVARAVVGLLAEGPRQADAIGRALGLEATAVSVALLELELGACVERVGGGVYRLVSGGAEW